MPPTSGSKSVRAPSLFSSSSESFSAFLDRKMPDPHFLSSALRSDFSSWQLALPSSNSISSLRFPLQPSPGSTPYPNGLPNGRIIPLGPLAPPSSPSDSFSAFFLWSFPSQNGRSASQHFFPFSPGWSL